jgi:hypothetical protein
MQYYPITTTGVTPIATGGTKVTSLVRLEVRGIAAASGSMVPQSRTSRLNAFAVPAGTTFPSFADTAYTNLRGASDVAAGTAITADGVYEIPSDGLEIGLNVTAVTGTIHCFVEVLEGRGGSAGGGGGGGSGGAITVANGADTAQGSTTDAPATAPTTTAPLTLLGLFKGALNYLKNIADNTSSSSSSSVVPTTNVDPTNTYVQPTGDTDSRSIFTVTSGKTADGATASGLSSVSVGSPDSGGLMRTPQSNLASVTPISTNDYGYTVNANLRGLSSANTLRTIVTATGFSAGGNAQNCLMVAEARAATATASAYEQVFNNLNVSVLTSAARTTTQTSADQTNFNHRGIKIVLDVTSGTGLSLTLALNGKDLNSAKYYNILTGAAVTGVGTYVYTVYPGATAVANLTVNDIIARLFQIVVTAGNATSATYSVSYSLLV